MPLRERIHREPFAAVHLGERIDRDVDDAASRGDERPMSRRSFADTYAAAGRRTGQPRSGIVLVHVVRRERRDVQLLPWHRSQSRDVVEIQHSSLGNAHRAACVAHVVHEHAPREPAIPRLTTRHGAVLHHPAAGSRSSAGRADGVAATLGSARSITASFPSRTATICAADCDGAGAV